MRTFVSSFNINIKISVNFCACVVWPFRHFVRCVSVSVFLIRWCKIYVVFHTVTITQKPSQCKNQEPKLYLRIDQSKQWEKNRMHKLCLGIYHVLPTASYLPLFIFTEGRIQQSKKSCHILPFFVKTVQFKRFFISKPFVFSIYIFGLRQIFGGKLCFGFSKTFLKRVNFGIFQTRSFSKQ